MKPGRARAVLRAAHSWLSLVLGLPIALIAASGAAVDYWFEVDALDAPAFYHGRASGPPLPLDRIAQAAHAAVPGGRIENIFLNHDGRVAIASLTGSWGERLRDIAIDRASGADLGQRWQDEALIYRLYDFHTTLMMGDAWRTLVLVFAIVFVMLIVSGLLLWWPSLAHWRAAFAWRLRPGHRLPDVHAKAGLYAFALMAVAGVTAVFLSWPSPEQPEADRPAAATSVIRTQRLQRLLDIALAPNPGWRAVNLLAFDDRAVPMRIILWRPATLLRSEAIRIVTVRRDTGAVARAPASDPHPRARALHNGRLGGELGRAAMALAALLPLLLWGTGMASWLRIRTLNRRRLAEGIGVIVPAEQKCPSFAGRKGHAFWDRHGGAGLLAGANQAGARLHSSGDLPRNTLGREHRLPPDP